MNTKFLHVEEGEIAYDDIGRGPLVVCVPGMGDVRGQYRLLAPHLAAAGHRVVTMDVRGHGETTPVWKDYSVSSIGRDIVALIHSVDSGPAVIIGNSMAAGAAVCAAADAPEAVSGLVMIGPAVHGDLGWTLRLVLSLLFARPWGPAAWLRYFATLYPARKPVDWESYTDALKRNLREPGRIEALKRMMKASKEASESRLAKCRVPALIVMGSKDPDFKDPEAEARWVAEHVEGSYRMIDGAGHYPHAEMPEETSPVITTFLAATRGQTTRGPKTR